MKVCVKCGEEKNLELFAKGRHYKDGRRGTCKRCHTDYVMEYYKANPEKKAEKVRMNSYYKPNWKKHGITKEQYDELVSSTNGKCHSCLDRPATSIDHDHACCPGSHSCGLCIRGVLCTQCNTSLGLLGDSIDMVTNLLRYISKA